MSKTASGNGRLRRARLAYKPVSGDRKSGMPADVLIPAPVYECQSRPEASSAGHSRYHHDDLPRSPIPDK